MIRTSASAFRWFAHTRASRMIRLSALVIAVLLLAACASQPRQGNSVEERAQQRWDALLTRDYDTAYSLYSPGYRSSSSRVDFEIEIRTRRLAYTGANVLESECSGDSCTVSTQVHYRIGQPVPGLPQWDSERRVEERWVRMDGQWWYVPE